MNKKDTIASSQKKKKPLLWRIIFGFVFLFFIQQKASALTVVDSTVNGKAVYVVTWTDNDGKPRKISIVKDADQTYVGVCQFISYYDGSTKIDITSPTPNDGAAHNTGFGATVHHKRNDQTSAFHHNGGTLTLIFQGDHHAVFNRVQTISGAIETVTYTFMDGHDYFQWQETLDATNGTLDGDSRGPYCTMKWDGVDFSAVTGQEYGAGKYFSQPSYNGAWTFNGTCDIPYVKQWDNGREVGYVQTQTYSQQMAGNPELSVNLASGASSVDASSATPTSGDDAWAFDYQMNFYDQAKKITWGLPYGYMNGSDATAGTKNKWGQYSLSVVFDALTEDGVIRLRDENRAVHNGDVSITANTGSVVTTGPVGTVNPATQTLSPAGYDHNYRTWWIAADGSGQVDVDIDVTGGAVLQNPTFRIKNMSGVPTSVVYNSVTLTSGTDYYASHYSDESEVWLTLVRNVSGSANLQVSSVSSGITINSATVTPTTVLNDGSETLDFSVDALDTDGLITSIELDLSSIGGSANTAMNAQGGTMYTYGYTVPNGTSTGGKSIVLTVTDDDGNTKTHSFNITVTAPITYLDIYTDAETKVTGTWNDDGILAEETGTGAMEGTKDYKFTFTAVNWGATFGLNLDNYGADPQLDASRYEYLEISYNGPATSGDGIYLQLQNTGGSSSTYNLSQVASYSTAQIPLSAFGAFDLTSITTIIIGVTGTESGSGVIRVDNIRLATTNPKPEMEVSVNGTSIANSGSYNFGSVEEGNSGSVITFTIENTGIASLDLNGSSIVTISGTDASMFSIDQTSTSNSVSASGSTTFTITFSPTSTGVKSAAISIDNNDDDEAPYVIDLTGTGTTATGVNGKLSANAYNIYPNPVGNSLHVSLDGISGEVKVIIRNQLGLAVMETESSIVSGSADYEIATKNLTPGIYYVELSTAQGHAVRKIVKQ